MSAAGWLATPVAGGAASIPLDDDIVHDVHGSANCICDPDCEPVIEDGVLHGVLWRHRALDGRET